MSNSPDRNTDVTTILKRATAGAPGAVERLFPMVYDELRGLARAKLAMERGDHTLQATALVHEVYLKLIDQASVDWHDRGHFFAVAGQAMRRILVDHARGKKRKKRGGSAEHVSLEFVEPITLDRDHDRVLALDRALSKLAEEHPDKARVVELRYFAGLSSEETAKHLDVSTRTVRRYWSYTQAWLYREIAGESPA